GGWSILRAIVGNTHPEDVARPAGFADEIPLHHRRVGLEYFVMDLEKPVIALGAPHGRGWIRSETFASFDPLASRRRHGRRWRQRWTRLFPLSCRKMTVGRRALFLAVACVLLAGFGPGRVAAQGTTPAGEMPPPAVTPIPAPVPPPVAAPPPAPAAPSE